MSAALDAQGVQRLNQEVTVSGGGGGVDWLALLDHVGAAVSLIGVPYLVVRQRQAAPHFSFNFAGSSRKFSARPDGNTIGDLSFTGTVRNHSLAASSIERLCLVVWRSEKHNASRRFGHGATSIKQNGVLITEPIVFAGRESKQLDIIFQISPVEGSVDEQLLKAMTPVSPGSHLYLPTYTYELAFEDMDGNLFDQSGHLANRRGMDLRWTLENTFPKLKEGNPFPLVWHYVRIGWAGVRFAVQRALRALGL